MAILGPPASGKGSVVKACVDAKSLKAVMEFLITKEAKAAEADAEKAGTPDCMVAALKSIVDKESAGWCLDNFPRSGAQAEKMKELGCVPDVVVIVEVEAQVILDFHKRRVMDEETGTLYDTKLTPPPAEIAEKCVQRSDDTEEVVKGKIDPWFAEIEKIKACFSDKLVCVKGTPETGEQAAISEELLTKLKEKGF